MTPRPAATEVIQFYVAPDGKEEWSGRLKRPAPKGADGPFATIHRAQKAVRELNKGQKQRRPVTVFISGTHYLEKPVVFTREDSGTADCPVIYTAHAGEKPVLSGGRRIVEWKKTEGGVWKAKLPKEMAGKIIPRQLFINGRRAVRARSPDTGYFKVEGLVDPKAGAKWNEGVDKFRFKPGDILPWKELNNVEVIVFHSWNTSRVRIASVDEKQSIVTFTGPTVFRPLGWDPNQRFYVENALEALDSPGEWYCDPQTGIVHYMPLPGEELNAAEVIVPMLSELLRFDGNADEGKFVEHVQVRGLSLRHSDWALPEKGYGDPQAAVTVPAAVMADGAIQCAIEECEIAHVGTYALWLRRGCKNNRIVQNHIHDMGAGGVRIGQSSMAKEDVAESSRNLISNNYIHDGGNVYPEGVGIWLAQSSHNRISHNEIHSFNYSGMSIGWNWGYQRNRTDHNTTENNHIHHVVRGVLSDGGGIYTLGTQTGSVLRNNLIHDVFPYMGKPTMAWGIYLDQASNGMLIENNIVYNTLTGGVMNAASPGNAIRNNIFAMSGWHGAWRWKWQQDPPTVVERNIFYLSRGELFHEDGGLSDFKTRWNRNLYWRSDGEPLLFYDYSFEEWQAKGMDEHSIVADPKFIDAGKGDFRLRADSPAHKLGFKPIDASKAGLIGPPEWVSLPKGAVFPPTRFPALPPEQLPVLADDGFEETDVGAPPRQARLYEEGKSDSIRVSAEAYATGKRSLKFTDAPGLEHIWNPHMFYTPHLKSGLVTLDFDLRLEAGAVFTHEWRDSKSPFTVGPSLRINSNGQLLAGGKPIAEVPFGKWIHVKIACGLGKRATGKYSLSLATPGEKARQFEGMPCAPTFRRLEWLGFVSLAEKHSVFYLDNVRLEREK
ncbi:MAG: right-handed parallel beta-helix repeat-containing protein [Planctomycetota bacterium]|nr:right-handed parallel beta-helix repeat-containing protein [Planctomycetota bacterium]